MSSSIPTSKAFYAVRETAWAFAGIRPSKERTEKLLHDFGVTDPLKREQLFNALQEEVRDVLDVKARTYEDYFIECRDNGTLMTLGDFENHQFLNISKSEYLRKVKLYEAASETALFSKLGLTFEVLRDVEWDLAQQRVPRFPQASRAEYESFLSKHGPNLDPEREDWEAGSFYLTDHRGARFRSKLRQLTPKDFEDVSDDSIIKSVETLRHLCFVEPEPEFPLAFTQLTLYIPKMTSLIESRWERMSPEIREAHSFDWNTVQDMVAKKRRITRAYNSIDATALSDVTKPAQSIWQGIKSSFSRKSRQNTTVDHSSRKPIANPMQTYISSEF